MYQPMKHRAITDLVLIPAVKGISDMIDKEEEILLPMSLGKAH